MSKRSGRKSRPIKRPKLKTKRKSKKQKPVMKKCTKMIGDVASPKMLKIQTINKKMSFVPNQPEACSFIRPKKLPMVLD